MTIVKLCKNELNAKGFYPKFFVSSKNKYKFVGVFFIVLD